MDDFTHEVARCQQQLDKLYNEHGSQVFRTATLQFLSEWHDQNMPFEHDESENEYPSPSIEDSPESSD